jgi:hypothetical protein
LLLASAVAYYTLLSIVQLLILILIALSQIIGRLSCSPRWGDIWNPGPVQGSDR